MATIIEFSDLKAALDLELSTFDDYPGFELLADGVHAALENYVGRKLDLVGKLKESGNIVGLDKFINLTNLPIVSVSSIVIDGDTLTSNDYEINNYGVTLNISNSGAWEITTKGGFKTIPDLVYRAELSQIVYEYQNKNNLAAKSFSNDGGSVSLPGFVLLNQVKDMLNKYRHVDKEGY